MPSLPFILLFSIQEQESQCLASQMARTASQLIITSSTVLSCSHLCHLVPQIGRSAVQQKRGAQLPLHVALVRPPEQSPPGAPLRDALVVRHRCGERTLGANLQPVNKRVRVSVDSITQ